MEFKVADVKEKEIDFLIAEELTASPSFLHIFLAHFEDFKNEKFIIEKIIRSHTDNYGESDLEVFLKSKKGLRLILLIENKVSAQFQTDQLSRYKKRGEAYLNQKVCDEYKIILVAPEDYGYDSNNYDSNNYDSNNYDSNNLEIHSRVYYEELKKWFTHNSQKSQRSKFKLALLKRAIERAKYGYQLVEDKSASQFWLDYWKFSNEIAPILNMPRPDKKPSGSGFIYFYPKNLSPDIGLIHKFFYGNIDLQLSGLATNIGEIRQLLHSVIPENLILTKAGKSVVIRKKVPILDVHEPVVKQRINVKACLEEAKAIYRWYINNRSSVTGTIEQIT